MNIPLFSFVRHSIDALCQAVKRRLHHWTKPDNHALVLNTVLQTYDLFFRTIFVFVMIELGSRRLVYFGVTRNPTDEWVAQQLREATPKRCA